MHKFNTNEGFVLNLMNVSPYGALSQLFIMEAIRFYSKIVSEKEVTEDEENSSALISPKAWQNVAKDIQARFNFQQGIVEKN